MRLPKREVSENKKKTGKYFKLFDKLIKNTINDKIGWFKV